MNQYIITQGPYELHDGYIAEWAANAFRDAIDEAQRKGYTLPKMQVFDGKQLLWEYVPRNDGICEVIKWSAPPSRTYRSIEWVLASMSGDAEDMR